MPTTKIEIIKPDGDKKELLIELPFLTPEQLRQFGKDLNHLRIICLAYLTRIPLSSPSPFVIDIFKEDSPFEILCSQLSGGEDLRKEILTQFGRDFFPKFVAFAKQALQNTDYLTILDYLPPYFGLENFDWE